MIFKSLAVGKGNEAIAVPFCSFSLRKLSLAMYFCLNTRVQRYSAGGVDTFVVRWYIVRITRNAHAREMEAGNYITLTVYKRVNLLIALG